MTNIYKVTTLIVLCFGLCAATILSRLQASQESKKTQVVIIGTLHTGHYKNPKYSPGILKEILLSLKLDAILIEAPLSHVDPNGRPLKKFRVKDPHLCPEIWVADEAAVQLGVKQIPFDRPDREQYRKKTKFYKRRKRSGELRDKWFAQTEKDNPESVELKISLLQDYAGQAQEYLQLNAGPKLINSKGFDSIVRAKDSVWENILPIIMGKDSRHKQAVDELRFLVNEWQQRNTIMANNIVKAAKQNPGKRLVVVTGATHRYILRDLLKDEKSIDLKEFWEIIDANSVKPEGNRLGTEQPDKQVGQDQVERSSK